MSWTRQSKHSASAHLLVLLMELIVPINSTMLAVSVLTMMMMRAMVSMETVLVGKMKTPLSSMLVEATKMVLVMKLALVNKMVLVLLVVLKKRQR